MCVEMAKCWLLVIGILGLSWGASCYIGNKYDNYTLVRIFPETEAQLEDVRHFEDPENKVEVLKWSREGNDSFDVLVPPERLDFIHAFARDMAHEVKARNYGRTIISLDRMPRRRILRNNIFQYMSHGAMQNFIENIANSHPSLVTLQPLGNSFEGRKMTLVKISSNPRAQNPVIFVDAGIHAREWVAPAMALYLIHRLTNDAESRQVDLGGVDWYILPLVNPDGYEFSRTSGDNRMWRKTRSKHTQSCYGVDGNRNYGFKWAVSGVSHNPCDKETYAGPKPFSETETTMVRKIMMEYRSRMKLYVSLHAYGQYLVYPWGYTGEYLPREWKKLDRLARMVSSAVTNAGGKPFNVLSAGRWYPASGGSDDFAFGHVGVPYSYTMELTDDYEFDFPENLLRVVLPQFYQGFRVFGQHINREFGNS